MRITFWAPERGVDDPVIIQSVLSLVMEHPPNIATIETWTKIERLLAYDWAMRHHYKASDNSWIRLRPKPSFVK